ncbi:MAG TPA: TolC family protein [Stellaceae bacterium]|nr:TolC family protein [Stellaceae bacterium]
MTLAACLALTPGVVLAAGSGDSGWQARVTRPPAPPSAPPAPAAGKPVPLTLPEAVFLGLRDNRAIRSEYLQRVIDKFALRVAEAQFYNPILNLNSALSMQRASGTRTISGNFSPTVTWEIPTGAQFTFAWNNLQSNVKGSPPKSVSQPTLEVIQPLLAGGGVEVATAPLRIARITEENNQLTLKSQLINTVTAIITAYYQFVQARDQLSLAEASLKRARDLLETNKLLVAAGRLAQVELVQSDAAITQQELQVVQAKNSFETARQALLVLLALDPASPIVPSATPTATPVKIDRAKALAVAYQNQPAYLSQLLTIKVNEINLVVAKNSRLWNLSVSGGTGQTSDGETIPSAVGGLPRTRADFNIGLNLTTAIGDPTLEQREVNAAITLHQSQLARDQLHDQVAQQVTDAVNNVDTQRQSLDIARRNRELSQQKLDIEVIKLQAGRSSNFQVVSFQNDLLSAQSTELQAVISYMTALATLDQVLGTTLNTWRISIND